MSTGDWDLFLGPLEWARAETGGGVIAKGIPRGCQGLFTPVSLGYPLSIFNKNSTLKGGKGIKRMGVDLRKD